MQYAVGTVNVTNASATVVGVGTSWSTGPQGPLPAGSLFTVLGSGIPYYTAALPTDNTHVALTAPYAGATLSGLPYSITTSFEPNLQIPYMNAGDVDTATIFKAAMVKIGQGLFPSQPGIITASTPYAIAQAWNAGGVTFKAQTISITDTASAAASLFVDYLVGAVSKFSVRKDGAVTAAAIISRVAAGQTAATFGDTTNGDLLRIITGAAASGITLASVNAAQTVYSQFFLSGSNFSLQIAGTEKLGISAAGVVTIPGALSVAGGITNTADRLILQNVAATGSCFITAINTGGNSYLGQSDVSGNGLLTGAGAYALAFAAATTRDLCLGTNDTVRVRVAAGGGVTISSLAGSGSRAVNADANGLLSAASDSRLKREVTAAKLPGLAEVMQLRPRAYQWLKFPGGPVEVGFFADEVNPIIPSAAPMGADGYYGFYDRSVTAALVRAVQQQQEQISHLRGRG